MGRLTTHVLDTTHGEPAAGLEIRLWRQGALLAETHTNADGRCDQPLLADTDMVADQYRLEFGVGDYFRKRGLSLPQPAFLEIVPITFGISDPAAHYHVPLLVSPFGYSTYRGS